MRSLRSSLNEVMAPIAINNINRRIPSHLSTDIAVRHLDTGAPTRLRRLARAVEDTAIGAAYEV
jgi:hypothetical protein